MFLVHHHIVYKWYQRAKNASAAMRSMKGLKLEQDPLTETFDLRLVKSEINSIRELYIRSNHALKNRAIVLDNEIATDSGFLMRIWLGCAFYKS